MESLINSNDDALAEAIRDSEETPCPCIGCPHLSRCQKADIACEAFYIYTQAPSVRLRGKTQPKEPTKKIFAAIFRTSDKTCHHPIAYRPRTTPEQKWLAEGMLQDGCTVEETARTCHLGKTTVLKIKKGITHVS